MQDATVTICNAIWRFAAVNLMTLGLALLGGVVLGAAPALCACLWATSSAEPAVVALLKGMWREWRAELVRANLCLLPCALLLVVIGIAASRAQGAVLMACLVAMTILLQVAMAVLIVVSRFRSGYVDTLRNAAVVVLMAPGRLLLVASVLPILGLLAVWQPLFGLYGALSCFSAVAARIVGPIRGGSGVAAAGGQIGAAA